MIAEIVSTHHVPGCVLVPPPPKCPSLNTPPVRSNITAHSSPEGGQDSQPESSEKADEVEPMAKRSADSWHDGATRPVERSASASRSCHPDASARSEWCRGAEPLAERDCKSPARTVNL